MNIAQYPDSLSLLGNIKNIIVNDSDPFTLALTSGSSTIMTENCCPVNGRCEINIRDVIASQLSLAVPSTDTFVQSAAAKTFTATATFSDDTTESRTFTVVKGGVDASAVSAATFLSANFLTWQPQVKRTRRLQPEWLTYYFVSAGSLTAKFYSASGSTTVTVGSGAAGACVSFNVQLARLLALTGAPASPYGIVDLYITNGSTRMTYIQRLAYAADAADDEFFIFENSVGGLDSCCFSGSETAVPEGEFDTATYDETLSQAPSSFKRTYSKNTGYLLKTEALWIEREFMSAAKKYAVRNSAVRLVTIDSTDVSNNSKEQLKAFTIKYRVAEDRGFQNLTRSDTLPSSVELDLPEQELFFLEARLVDLADCELEDTQLFLTQSPFSQEWRKLSWGAVYSAIFSGVESSITSALEVLSGYVLQSVFQKSLSDIYKQMAAVAAASGSLLIESAIVRGRHIAAKEADAAAGTEAVAEHFEDEEGEEAAPRITTLYLDIDTYKLWIYTFYTTTADNVVTEHWYWLCITPDVIISCTHVDAAGDVAEHFTDTAGAVVTLLPNRLYLDGATHKLYVYTETTADNVVTGVITCVNPDPYYQVATGTMNYGTGLFEGADDHSTALLAKAGVLYVDTAKGLTFLYLSGAYSALHSGSAVETLYALTSSTSAPAKPDTTQTDCYVPASLWTPYPQRVTSSSQYCWVTYRLKSNGLWGAWSAPAICYGFVQGTSMRYLGKWSDIADYTQIVNNSAYIDTVTYNDQLYICILTHTKYSFWPPSEDDRWRLAAGKGADGTTSYTYIRYSANADGTDFTATPDSTTQYLGVCVSATATAPTAKTAYTWSLIKGGTGTAGASQYVHIRYSDDGGTTFTANDKPGIYIGVLVDSDATASDDVTKYTWSKIKGADGKDIEWIYILTATDTRPATPVKPVADNSDDNYPSDWSDDPLDVSASMPFEWTSFREKADGVWGAYTAPHRWAHYGQDGKDTEYIYTRTDPGNTAPVAEHKDNRDDDLPASGGWTDDPQGVDEVNQDEWFSLRHKTDGVWGAYTAPHRWLHWQSGTDGVDGADSYRLDLDNSLGAVACDADGTPLPGVALPSTNARLYKGSSRLTTGLSFSLAAAGCTATGTMTDGVYAVTVTAVSGSAPKVVITEASTGLSVTFGIILVLKDEVFRLSPEVNAIVKDGNGTISPSAVKCSVTRSTGTGSPAEVQWSTGHGLTVKWRRSSAAGTLTVYPEPVYEGDELVQNSSVTVNGTDTYIDWFLYDSEGNLLDYERIPVVSDGAAGISVMLGYDDNFLAADYAGKNSNTQTKTVHIYVLKGGVAVQPSGIAVNGNLPANSAGVTMCGSPTFSLSAASTFSVTFNADVVLENGQITFDVTYNGVTYQLVWCFAVIRAAENGEAGAILRPRGVWNTTSTYVWNSQYRDFVYYNGGYYVVKTKPATGGETRTTTGSFVAGEWQVADEVAFVFAQLLFADNALIEFLATTTLKILDSKGTVCGGLQGGDIIFWAGDASSAAAPFRVYKDGSVYANNIQAVGTFIIRDKDGGIVQLANDALSIIDADGNLSVAVTNKAIPTIASLATTPSVTPTNAFTTAKSVTATQDSEDLRAESTILKFTVDLSSYAGKNFKLTLPVLTKTVSYTGTGVDGYYFGCAIFHVYDASNQQVSACHVDNAFGHVVALAGGQTYTVKLYMLAEITTHTSEGPLTVTTTVSGTANATIAYDVEGTTVGKDGLAVVQSATKYLHVQHDGSDLLFNLRNGLKKVWMNQYGWDASTALGYVSATNSGAGGTKYASMQTSSGSLTLSADYPQLIVCNATANKSIILPSPSSLENGYTFRICNISAEHYVYVNGYNGTGPIYKYSGTSSTSILLQYGTFADFVVLNNCWYVMYSGQRI